MNIEEYIEKASENIKNKKVREQFKKELYGHILDRAEYYTDAGYDEETALSKTLGQMGEPENISDGMGMIHGKAEKIEYVLLILLILFSMFILAVMFFFNLAADDRNVNNLPLLEIVFSVLIPLGMSRDFLSGTLMRTAIKASENFSEINIKPLTRSTKRGFQ